MDDEIKEEFLTRFKALLSEYKVNIRYSDDDIFVVNNSNEVYLIVEGDTICSRDIKINKCNPSF